MCGPINDQPRQTFWRVLVLNPVNRVWWVSKQCDTPQEAIALRADLIRRGRRAHIRKYTKKLLAPKPPNNTQARRDREAAEQQMSDRADALKKYKSPG